MSSINHNGISVCLAGEEKYVYLTPRPRRKNRYCQYDYRHTDGELSSAPLPLRWSSAEPSETCGYKTSNHTKRKRTQSIKGFTSATFCQ